MAAIASNALLAPRVAMPSVWVKPVQHVPQQAVLVPSQQPSLTRMFQPASTCSSRRHAWPFSRPPPPPPWWRQPTTWIAAGAAVLLAALIALALRARRRALETARLPKMSLGEMYYRLEKVVGSPGLENVESAASAAAPRIPKSTLTPLPPPVKSAAPLPPAAVAPPPAVPEPPAPEPAPEAPPAPKPSANKGFSFLSGGDKKAAVPSLDELVAGEDDRTKFLRAVASQLRLDSPQDVFDNLEGLQSIPPTVPLETRTLLLQQAVRAEAERFTPIECAALVVDVAKSMAASLVDRASNMKDAKLRAAALSEACILVSSAEHMCTELAPDVEAAKITYEGTLRYKRLEELFSEYLEQSLEDLNEIVAAVSADPAKLQQKAAQQDLLAGLFKISEGRMTKMTEKIMEKKFAGLGSLFGQS